MSRPRALASVGVVGVIVGLAAGGVGTSAVWALLALAMLLAGLAEVGSG
jgi:hypothetical protein